MALEPRHLKDVLARQPRALGVRELIRVAGLHPGQQTELKRVLRELVRTGELQKEGKRFVVPRAPPERPPDGGRRRGRGEAARGVEGKRIDGVLHVHPSGFGFVHPLSGEGENIYLPAREASRALDNDRVRVVLAGRGRGGKVEGRLLEVLERRREQVVGTYLRQGRRAHVMPSDSSLPGPIRVPPTQLARHGDLVKVRLGVGAGLLAGEEGELFGEVSGSLGRPGEPSAEVLSITFAQGFSDEFPARVMDQADGIPLAVSEREARAEGRRDLRGLSLVTIDGEDARDFDDAVWAERRPGGSFRLVVAIADVSHYVQEGAPLDREALARGTSVYLPGRVLPMLPERLSAGICSLLPGEDRLCMVADLEVDRTGRTRSAQIYPGVMKSAARCTYTEVQALLDGQAVPRLEALGPQLEVLRDVARVLHRMRRRRGAIDFDLPETRVVLDEAGRPSRMERRERKDAHRLVEECMLAANEAVARFFREQELPSVYRYHAPPDAKKLLAFATLAQAHGFLLGASGARLSSRELSDFVEKLAGHPERRALNQLLLRAMMQALYSAESVGHFGLAAKHYLHFTSPIRRYPDLVVHRLLKAHWRRKGKARPPPELERETGRLEQVAARSSERERAAIAIEREVVAYYSALLMKDRVGEDFPSTVSAVTDFGFFAELDEEYVEGLVKAEALGRGFRLDPSLHALVYPSGRKVRVGQRVQVRVASVNLERRQIDLDVVAFEDESPRAPPSESGPRRRGGSRVKRRK